MCPELGKSKRVSCLIAGIVDELRDVLHELVVLGVIVGDPVLEWVVVDRRHVPRDGAQVLIQVAHR